MTARVLVSQVIECGEAEFWKTFFDRDLSRRLFLEGLGFKGYETTEQVESDDEIKRTIRAEPKLALPGPLQKMFASGFHYLEQGSFDKRTKTWRWKMIPSTLTDKLIVNGKLTVVALGDAQVRREIDVTIDCKVMMVGGLIEDTFKKQMEDGWNKGAEVQNRWLREAKP